MGLVDQEEEEALSTLLRYSHACNLIGDHLTPQHSGCPTGAHRTPTLRWWAVDLTCCVVS
jgi:hypothetical protein